MNQPRIIAAIRSANDRAAAFRQIHIEATCPEDIRDGLSILAYETAKSETGLLRAGKRPEIAFNDSRTKAALTLTVDGWYVRVTVCLVTRRLLSVDDERPVAMRGAA